MEYFCCKARGQVSRYASGSYDRRDAAAKLHWLHSVAADVVAYPILYAWPSGIRVFPHCFKKSHTFTVDV